MRKAILSALVGVFITGGVLVAFKDHVVKVWAAPKEIESVRKETAENTQIQKQLTDITQRQQTQIEVQQKELGHQKELNALQIESLKELVKEIKKK